MTRGGEEERGGREGAGEKVEQDEGRLRGIGDVAAIEFDLPGKTGSGQLKIARFQSDPSRDVLRIAPE